ncbi:MAG: ATP-binding protein, partial [Blastocatellia bacterium]
NLLTAIIGYSDLLMADPQAGGYSRDCADEIRKAGKRASTLTSQLLAFSRKQVLSTTSLNLNDVVAETQSMLRRVIGEDVKLVSNLNANLWHISGDQGQIEQILLNLAVNSRDAMPAGGTLTVETANVDSARLEEAPDRSGGRYVMLRVTDTGCGMDGDTMSRIFEPFFTTKERGKGTGLGLSTVYGIVKQSGGVIDAESEEGMGASFTIYLPAAAETKAAVEPPRVQVQSGGGTETVLVVEDDDAVLRLTSEVLVSAGYTVLQAQNVEDAIRSLEEKNGKVDLVLTDIVLPAANAMALTQGPSALKGPTKLLFMSGYSDDNLPLLSESVRSGAFLQKPFTPNALLSKVREVLTRA